MIRPIAIVLMAMTVGSVQAAPVAREDLERHVMELGKMPPSQVTVENVEFDGPYPMVWHDGRQRAAIRMRGRLINRGTTTVNVRYLDLKLYDCPKARLDEACVVVAKVDYRLGSLSQQMQVLSDPGTSIPQMTDAYGGFTSTPAPPLNLGPREARDFDEEVRFAHPIRIRGHSYLTW